VTQPSAQHDRFVHERLPARRDWPEMILPQGFVAGSRFNCVEALLEKHLKNGHGDDIALVSETECWSYAELDSRVNRFANVLTRDYGVQAGNRVLLRGYNSPILAALWLAVQKCGAIAVTTMCLLRSSELSAILDIARPTLALCEDSLVAELAAAAPSESAICEICTWNGDDGDLERRAAVQPEQFDTCPTREDDISLIGFTSGTTGKPKATIHFQRDVLAICHTVADHLLQPTRQDVFIGTSPLAFTFGLGGLVIFPLYAGARSVLQARYDPAQLLQAIESFRATICFTVPTFYQRMAGLAKPSMTSSLRLAACSGEALPQPVRREWHQHSGIELTELLGSTEMLHAFIGSTGADVKPGFIGPALPGYEAAIIDDDGQPLPPGTIGRLAVKGPTGCRYLADPRQRDYVQNGWNLTGDAGFMDEDGYVAYHTRYDDMIISAGYNISGIEIENTLLRHPLVRECAVIGSPDEQRGQVVTAYVVAATDGIESETVIEQLQDFVKQQLAPYKYPRRIYFVEQLPRNESGKLQRFRLRQDHAER